MKESALPFLNVLVAVTGGLGVFLLGMKHLSEGLQAIGGGWLRKFMSLATRGHVASVGTGVVSTLIVQSSAIITAMLVGSVSSGMMTLAQAVNVIIGANIGTTGTVWIVAYAPSSALTGLACLAVGGALYFFVRRETLRNFGLAVLGLGLFLLGLCFIAKGVEPLKGGEFAQWMFDAAGIASTGGVALIALCAAVVSVAIHSAATIALAMILAAQGLIPYEAAVASLFGANIGTTVTAWIAATGGNSPARRTALAHTLLNVIGSAVFLPLVLPAFVPMGKALIPYCGAMVAIAVTDTVFAIVRGVVAFPFVRPFERLLMRLIPGKGEEKPHLSTLKIGTKVSPVIACDQALVEVQFMRDSDIDLFDSVRRVLSGQDAPDEDNECHIVHREDILDNVQREITDFLASIMSKRLAADVSARAQRLLRLTDELESVSDEAAAILKVVKRLRNNKQRISDVSVVTVLSVHDRVQAFAAKVSPWIRSPRPTIDIASVQDESHNIHEFIRERRRTQLGRVGVDDPGSSLRVLGELDIINAYERIRACYLNIAETLAGGKAQWIN